MWHTLHGIWALGVIDTSGLGFSSNKRHGCRGGCSVKGRDKYLLVAHELKNLMAIDT
jgi:hypothetical protein